jgi:hypothetical protein
MQKYRQKMREVFQEYMSSKEWHNVRKIVIENSKGICADCGCTPKKSFIHHLDYTYWGEGSYEEANHCILLCSKCHNIRHSGDDVNVPFFASQNANDGLSIEEFKDIQRRLEIPDEPDYNVIHQILQEMKERCKFSDEQTTIILRMLNCVMDGGLV